MTVIAIMAGLISIGLCAVGDFDSEKNEIISKDSLKTLTDELETATKERDALEWALKNRTEEIASLRKELEDKDDKGRGIGPPPCLGYADEENLRNPIPLIVIRVLPNSYRVRVNPGVQNNPLVRELLPYIREDNLNSLQIRSLSQEIEESGRMQPDGGCIFLARLENGLGSNNSATRQKLRHRHGDDIGLPLVNSSIIAR